MYIGDNNNNKIIIGRLLLDKKCRIRITIQDVSSLWSDSNLNGGLGLFRPLVQNTTVVPVINQPSTNRLSDQITNLKLGRCRYNHRGEILQNESNI